MCGIAGLLLLEPQAVPAERLQAILTRLAHRGPDDRGILWSGDDVSRGRTAETRPARTVLLHRRLAIIDLSENGWQPMSTAGNRFHIVFNGEIYNYRELRDELRRGGVQFATESDTEVLLHLLVREGPTALTRLTGMFAFALLDRQKGSLLLARDFFGIKPLYLAPWRDGLAFASEVGPLLDLPGLGRGIDAGAAIEYLRYGYTDRSERTMFSAIRQVLPGHWLEIDVTSLAVSPQHCYWRPQPGTAARAPRATAARDLRDRFVESVRLHLRSDVPLGFFLSGGIDSSAIVAAARRLEPQHDLKTFSYVASGQKFDETHWIDMVSQAVHAPNWRTALSGEQFRADFRHWVDVQGEPVGASNVYAGYHVARLARENGVVVCLDGQGGDEIAGGYSRIVAMRLAGLLRQGRLIRAAGLARAAAGLLQGFSDVLPQTIEHLPLGRIKNHLRNLYGRPRTPAWMDVGWIESQGLGIETAEEAAGGGSLTDFMARMLSDLNIPRFMRYGDRNSMAFSLELRVPFLNQHLADFMLAQPEEYIVDDSAMVKSLFREAMRGLVPDPVLDRRDKIGYDTPEAEWLRSDPAWTRAWLDVPALASAPFLRVDRMKAELESFLAGRTPFHHRFFRWINFACWAEQAGVSVR